MRFIPQGDAVHEGDLVVTSGLGLQPYEQQALPRGLAIGQVLRVEPAADLHQEAELLPAVDFDHLEKVMIVFGILIAISMVLSLIVSLGTYTF